MSRFYGSNQMIICAAGQLDHDRFAGLVRDRFSGVHLSEEPGRLTPSGRRAATADRDLEQTHTVFGFSAPGIRSAQRFDMMVLANLYGGGMSSRLFQKVREERGLCYSIFAFSQMLSDAGVFGVYAGTSQAQANEMLEVCAAELKDCRINISTDELSRSKQQLKAAVLMRLDSVSASLDSLARQIALFGEPRDKDEMIREIEAVSQDSLHALVAQLTTSRPRDGHSRASQWGDGDRRAGRPVCGLILLRLYRWLTTGSPDSARSAQNFYPTTILFRF